MSAAPWSGALAIGVGWAALDARLGKNTAHAHLAHQVILGLDGAVVVTTNSEIVAPTGKAIHIPAGQTHSIGPEGRLTRSIYIDPRFPEFETISNAISLPAFRMIYQPL